MTGVGLLSARFGVFIESDDILEDEDAWEQSDAPLGFYKLLDNVNNNKYTNPGAYLTDIHALVQKHWNA